VVFLVIALLIGPVFIAPLFNDYKPLEPGPVRDTVLSMARANGVPADNVWMFDASRQSKRISANVSGILGTLRISLNDNLLNRSTPEEIQMVMAHELGHYVLNHIPKMLLTFSLVLLAGFAFIAWAFPRVLARWGARWGVEDIRDPAGLPLLMALLSV
jgi:STE24 endopeptidase